MINTQIQQITPGSKKAVLSGLVRFVDLLGRVRYSYKKDKNDGDFQSDFEYQRRVDVNRLSDISKFIGRSINAAEKGNTAPIFPTSIILAADNEWVDFDKAKPGLGITLESIPSGTLIVDGQHRYFGMLKLYEDSQRNGSSNVVRYLSDYYFNCTILVNYDLWEQAQVFASVNFNQKKVNKSLFYDIYGIQLPDNDYSVIPKQNEIYIAHQLVKHLDSSENSPFKGFVRMLGKGEGFISQAFLVECFMKHLSVNGIWSDTVQGLKNTGRLNNFPASELTAYLAVIKSVFEEYWPQEFTPKPTSLLCKTTGVGAIMQFLTIIHNALPPEVIQEDKDNHGPISYAELIAEINKLVEPLKPFGQEFFEISSDSKYAGGAGKGMQSKLFEAIHEKWKQVV